MCGVQMFNGYSLNSAFTKDTIAEQKFNHIFLDAYTPLFHSHGNKNRGNLITPLMFCTSFFSYSAAIGERI